MASIPTTSAVPRILYIDTDPVDSQQKMKLAGIRNYASGRGWDVIPLPSRKSRPDVLPEILRDLRPIGVVVEGSGGKSDLPPKFFGDIPVVYIDASKARYRGRLANVVADDSAVARMAIRELSANMPCAFAFVGVYFETSWERERRAAFCSIARSAGLPFRIFRRFPEEKQNPQAYVRRLARWLAGLPLHAAVFAVNDMTASQVAEAAAVAGRRIPQDLTLIGVDNLARYVEKSNPTLTSIQLDFEHAGWLAARLLDDMMRSRRKVSSQVRYGPLLCIRRESTRGFGRREPHVLTAVEIIRREACAGLGPKDLVARVPGSRRLLDLRFREAMGHSVLNEIQSVRLEKACTLLIATDTPIDEIPKLCGFNSGRTLRKLFRSRMGMSMREFRFNNARRDRQ